MSNLQVSPRRDKKSWRAFESCHLRTTRKRNEVFTSKSE